MSTNQAAGVLFLTGVMAALIAITTPNYTSLTSKAWDVPSDMSRLEMIAAHSGAWRWASMWWATGSVFSVFGFSLMAVVFHRTGESMLGEIAIFCYFLGGILWLVAMAYRMGIEPLVTDAAGNTDELPAWFKPVEAWSLYIMLFYLVLAYSAIGMLGGLVFTDIWSVSSTVHDTQRSASARYRILDLRITDFATSADAYHWRNVAGAKIIEAMHHDSRGKYAWRDLCRKAS